MTTMAFPALPTTWNLDGFDFNVGADSQGHSTIVDVPGWDDPPGPKPKITEKSEDHGAYRGPNYTSSKVVSIVGWAEAPTPRAREVLRDRLAGLCLDYNTLYPLTCYNPNRDTALTMWVERNDTPAIRPARDGVHLTLDYQLIAVDGWKYSPDNPASTTGFATASSDGILWNGSPAASGGIEWNGSPTVTGGLIYQSQGGSSGVLRLTNSGTREAPIRLSFSATAVNPLITNVQTGQRVKWIGTIAGTSVLRLDSKTKRAYLDEVSVNATLAETDFFGVPKQGFVDIAYSADSGSGSILTAINANVYA